MLKKTLAVAALAVVAAAGTAEARDQIRIVGSSTVYPFSTVVAENFGKTTSFKTPVIESTGTGGGFKLFCAGVGTEHPDFTNASRPIKKSEFEMCRKNGVKDIIEIRVGYDGIVLAADANAPALDVTRQQLFQALAKTVPVNGKWVANPNKTWSDIDPSLPATAISVFGPPPTSGTRDAFVELVMEHGCEEFPEFAEIKGDKAKSKEVCQSIREDGVFIEAGENDNLIVQKLQANPSTYGIFGFSFLDQNHHVLAGAKVEGVEPTFENIADGQYSVSRPLQFYAKKAHVAVIPGMADYLKEFTSEQAWGDEGYLTDKGLIPMPQDEREKFRSNAVDLNAMSAGEV